MGSYTNIRFTRYTYLVLSFVLGGINTLFGQDIGNSPYSRFGIGDITPSAYAAQAGMANIGYSFLKQNYISNTNVALLPRNRNTVFEAGVVGGLKVISDKISQQQDFGGNINYASFVFPVKKDWSLSIGIVPYSSVSYKNTYTQKIAGSNLTADYSYSGTGSLNTVFIANGVRVYKEFYVGLKLSYLFGSTKKEASSVVNTNVDDIKVAYFQQNTYSDLILEPSFAASFKLNEKSFLNAGFTVVLPQNLSGKQFISVNRQTTSGFPIATDTLINNAKGSIQIPAKYNFGLSVNQDYRWMVGLDFSYQDWTGYKDFDAADTLSSSYTIAIGGEIIPDAFSNSKRDFWKRFSYRAGFRYTVLPYKVFGTRIDDISASAGFSFPFSRGRTELHLSATIGRRGTLVKNLIKEDYIKFSLGVTINDKWFIKRKYD